MRREKGITLIALVITIIVLLILAGVSIATLMGKNGLLTKATRAKEEHKISKVREELVIVLADAQIEKNTNKEYNQYSFLDEFILNQEPDVKILDEIIIKDGYAFGLDRSAPKLGEYIGKEEELVFPNLNVETVVSEDAKTATIKINAIEPKNGISKIEILQEGFVVEKYTYSDKKEPITENFVTKQNGEYIIKVYSKLNISKMTKAEGLISTVKYSPNGDEIYKKEHLVKITADETGEKIKSIKYQWLETTKEPETYTFVESCNNRDTIIGNGMTGTWYLWTLLETETGKTNIARSEAFHFDNEGPATSVSMAPISETSFVLTVNATDEFSEIAKYEFYVDGKLENTQNITEGEAIYTREGTGMDEIQCYVLVSDKVGNTTRKDIKARTKMHKWSKYDTKGILEYSWAKGDYVGKVLGTQSGGTERMKAFRFTYFVKETGGFEVRTQRYNDWAQFSSGELATHDSFGTVYAICERGSATEVYVWCYRVVVSSMTKLVKGDNKLEEIFNKDEFAHKHNEVDGNFYWKYEGIQ